jgi:hypothetical protein
MSDGRIFDGPTVCCRKMLGAWARLSRTNGGSLQARAGAAALPGCSRCRDGPAVLDLWFATSVNCDSGSLRGWIAAPLTALSLIIGTSGNHPMNDAPSNCQCQRQQRQLAHWLPCVILHCAYSARHDSRRPAPRQRSHPLMNVVRGWIAAPATALFLSALDSALCLALPVCLWARLRLSTWRAGSNF